MKSETGKQKPKQRKTLKSLLEVPEALNKRIKIEGAKRGLNITDTILVVLDENLEKG